jgi:hypothetical protein
MSASTTLTLAELITAVRQRADFVNSNFITDAEFTSYINQSYFELYDLLVQCYGGNYFVAPPFFFQTDGINDFFPLPDDFYKLLGLDLSLTNRITNDSWVTIQPFNFKERNRYAVPNFQSFYGVTNLRYRIQNSEPTTLWLTPIPSNNQTLRVWYIPELTTLVLPSDTLDQIGGWGEYIIVDSCIKALAKEESDTSVFERQKADLKIRIEAAADNRDAGSPITVVDNFSGNFGGAWGDGTNGSGASWW